MPSTESYQLLLQKVNAQILEFNPQGTLAAIGCKFGNVLIFDMLAKEVIRCFSYAPMSDKECLHLNTDVDQFAVYRKVNFAYDIDDFVSHFQPSGSKEEKKDEPMTDTYFKIESNK